MRQRHSSSYRSGLSRRGLLIGSAAAALGARSGLAAQSATPASDALPPFADRIGMLLAMAPARDLTPEVPIPFYYADPERQMAEVGIELPDPNVALDTLADGYSQASLALPLAADAFRNGLLPEWLETFGFNPFGVSQAITLNDPPNVVTVFMGRFDIGSVEGTLETSGYQPILQETGGAYWTVGDDLDLESLVGRLGVGTMNHAAVYEDALVFAQRETAMRDITQTVAGLAPAMLEQDVWPRMAGLFSPDTVGLIPVSFGILETMDAGSGVELATPKSGDARQVQYLAFGVRAGALGEPMSLVGEGTPEATPVSEIAGVPARIEARIRYSDPATAEREAEAIPQRWGELSSLFSGQPYSELMQIEDSRIHHDDDSVVAIDFISYVPNRWIQMIQTRDLAPFLPVVG